jgi:hypothetical protein
MHLFAEYPAVATVGIRAGNSERAVMDGNFGVAFRGYAVIARTLYMLYLRVDNYEPENKKGNG